MVTRAAAMEIQANRVRNARFTGEKSSRRGSSDRNDDGGQGEASSGDPIEGQSPGHDKRWLNLPAK
jgi:hypothetical protein